jgi:chromosome segregation ATPase
MSKTHVIDGKKYLEVEREAIFGDKLWLVNISCSSKVGGYYSVEEVNRDIKDGIVKVLEPLVEECSEASPNIHDLLANLARRVSSLEQQLRDTQGNVEKLAEELANTKHRVSKHASMFGIVEERVGMLTDDIITLDERSQVLNAINKFYEEGCR